MSHSTLSTQARPLIQKQVQNHLRQEQDNLIENSHSKPLQTNEQSLTLSQNIVSNAVHGCLLGCYAAFIPGSLFFCGPGDSPLFGMSPCESNAVARYSVLGLTCLGSLAGGFIALYEHYSAEYAFHSLA